MIKDVKVRENGSLAYGPLNRDRGQRLYMSATDPATVKGRRADVLLSPHVLGVILRNLAESAPDVLYEAANRARELHDAKRNRAIVWDDPTATANDRMRAGDRDNQAAMLADSEHMRRLITGERTF